MNKIELDEIKNTPYNDVRISVGLGTCGISAGARDVYELLKEEIKSKNLDIDVFPTGCIGLCKYEPIVEVYKNGKRITYINVDSEKLFKIINEHVMKDTIVKEYLINENILSILEDPFIKKQVRVALKNCGNINPEDINDYIKKDGYYALYKVLTEMTKDEVIEEIKKSKLRGRGGAGFSTGLKWELTRKEIADYKYVCCNADEGDPGAFMDRALLEGDPHSVIEAMAIAAYAIGAKEGYIYVRAEYPVAVNRLKIAIKQAKELGLIGNNIFNTNFSFDLDLRLGAGAFVCGEETALINSIEGKRGEPRLKPPFPSQSGLFEKPTLINNVETYANVPYIILNGSDFFTKIGTEKSKGTKVFALGGKVNTTGLIEVPIGISLKEILDIAGGIPNAKKFKAAQTGGPSGGCIPSELIDISIDYETLKEIGSMMGSGGLIVMDEDNCMVNMSKFFLNFTVDESCGKCVPCRIGTKRLYEILERITTGKGEEKDLETLEELSKYIKENSLCGLGQSAPNPVLSNLKYFKEEFIDHIVNKKCESKVCSDLLNYNIISEKCVGCDICKKNCPVGAITGEIKEAHKIDQEKCIKCGTCIKVCKFKAIIRE